MTAYMLVFDYMFYQTSADMSISDFEGKVFTDNREVGIMLDKFAEQINSKFPATYEYLSVGFKHVTKDDVSMYKMSNFIKGVNTRAIDLTDKKITLIFIK